MMMPARKPVMLSIILLVALMVFPVIGRAQTALYRCQVLSAGPTGDTQTTLMLRGISPAFDDRWFVANPLRNKEQLAVALAAMINNREVLAQVDLDQPGKPEIVSIVLTNQGITDQGL